MSQKFNDESFEDLLELLKLDNEELDKKYIESKKIFEKEYFESYDELMKLYNQQRNPDSPFTIYNMSSSKTSYLNKNKDIQKLETFFKMFEQN